MSEGHVPRRRDDAGDPVGADALIDDAVIENWARARAAADVPSGFADRVVAAAVASDAKARRERVVRAALLTLAGVAGALRVAAALAVFITD